MLISPDSEAPSSSRIPFPLGSRDSANPFAHLGQAQCRPDILVIEDDKELSGWLSEKLQACDSNPVAVFSGEEGLDLLSTRRFALVLLDWRLPGCDGITVLRTLRARSDRTPIFLMSGFDAIEDRIFGFENGADDYLVKPFAFPELLARIRARFRRAWSGEERQWRIGDLTLDIESRRIDRAGREVALTPREFDLLLYLVQHRNEVVTREMLGREVWRVAQGSLSLDNGIDVHIAHLRRKIDAEHHVKLIHTIRGKGFMICEDRAVQGLA